MPRSRRAFTIIELLVVMGIIVTLASLLAVGLMGAKDKAKNKGTAALVNKIKVALESYHADFRDFPPDGYDDELDWGYTATGGIDCGTPPGQQYQLKGTAALMYFLCRPLIKVTYVGSDISDPRNRVQKKVGPYLDLRGADYSMKQRTRASGEVMDFNPAFNWDDITYWETSGLGFRLCEIIDAYGRPLFYDKVKTSDPGGIYWNPALYQNTGGSLGNGRGQFVHSDQEYFDSGRIGLLGDSEPEGYQEMTEAELITKRFSPRFRSDSALYGGDVRAYLDGLFVGATGTEGSDPPTGTDADLMPRYDGGYDLWSCGRSWVDPRDDITSWGQ